MTKEPETPKEFLYAACAQNFRQRLDYGDVSRLARQKGIDYQSAYKQIRDEEFQPWREQHLEDLEREKRQNLEKLYKEDI